MRLLQNKLVWASILSCSALAAQNSDLGLFWGIALPTREVVGVLNQRVTTAVGLGGQINYAWQVHTSRAGDLYLELPFVVIGHNNVNIATDVGEFDNGALLLTPGIRFKRLVKPRVALYLAGGVGAGWFNNTESRTTPTGVFRYGRSGTTGVLDLGGGVDFRLTRFVSLRAESREFFTPSRSAFLGGRNHVIFHFGLGFHF